VSTDDDRREAAAALASSAFAEPKPYDPADWHWDDINRHQQKIAAMVARAVVGTRDAEIIRVRGQRDEARRALRVFTPAPRSVEDVQLEAGAIRFAWADRFAALLNEATVRDEHAPILDNRTVSTVLDIWETLLVEQITARAALESAASPSAPEEQQ
jgi:hypothetical protein